MAKLSAHGAHVVERWENSTTPDAPTYRIQLALRSDGVWLRRFPPDGWHIVKASDAKVRKHLESRNFRRIKA